jgi:hypothetical protein
MEKIVNWIKADLKRSAFIGVFAVILVLSIAGVI